LSNANILRTREKWVLQMRTRPSVVKTERFSKIMVCPAQGQEEVSFL